MNITPSTIYWITRLDYINLVFGCAIIIGIAFIILLAMRFALVEDEDEVRKVVSVKAIAVPIAIAVFGSVFTPTSKELAAMIVIPKIENSETVQGIGKEIVELAHEWIKELKPKAEREGK